MSWSVAVSGVTTDSIRTESREAFNKNYPEAAHSVINEFKTAVEGALELMWDGFQSSDLIDYDQVDDVPTFNVSLSGHTRTSQDDNAESFISVIVTLRKPETTGAEVKDAQAKEPVNA